MNGCPDKLICSKCGKKLDVSELNPFDEFFCPGCGGRIKCPMQFERYFLMDLCGIGGMSKVYRAFDPVENMTVAVKITDADIFNAPAEGQRFTFEAELVAKINHPGIVRVYRGGIFNKQPFLVMEFMKKGTLETLQKSFMLPPAEKILSWLAIIADGLYAADKLGIVHHDVKPANIMLSEDGEVKIGDFDLAEINTDNNSNSSDWASIAYVSPERLQSGKEDSRGDIFSLGASAYELLTGEYPFGNTGEVAEILERRRISNYEAINHLNSTVPASIAAFIREMMAFEPEKRPSYPEIISMFRSFGKTEKNKSAKKFSLFRKNQF